MFYIRFQYTGVNKIQIHNLVYIQYPMITLIRATEALQSESREKQIQSYKRVTLINKKISTEFNLQVGIQTKQILICITHSCFLYQTGYPYTNCINTQCILCWKNHEYPHSTINKCNIQATIYEMFLRNINFIASNWGHIVGYEARMMRRETECRG